jgi:hypothetical protein
MEKMKIVHVYKSFNVYNGLIEILTILAQNMDHARYELGVCVYDTRKTLSVRGLRSLEGRFLI